MAACLWVMLFTLSTAKAQPGRLAWQNRSSPAHEQQAPASNNQGQAGQILDASGVKGGLVVHVGCGDGRLTAALHANDSYLVHGLDADADNIEKARAHIRSVGLYGTVSVEQFTLNRLPYADNLVNLVVSEDLGQVSPEEVMRVLAPDGVAYVKEGGQWTRTFKPRPEEIDEWTHYLYDASGNAVAHDLVVGPPRRFQWIGSPRWSRHHDRMASLSVCVSAAGRIFYILDEGSRVSVQLPSKWTLIARDAFNGTILWKHPISSWMTQLWPFKSGPAQLQRRLVAVGDRVYVTLGLDGAPLSELDAATGQIIQTYGETQMTEELIFSEGVLFLMVKPDPPATGWNEYLPTHRTIGQAKSRVASEWPWDEANRQIIAIQADTGRVLWQREHPVAPLTLAADLECVYFHDGRRVICLNRETGNPVWTSSPVARRSPMAANFGPTLVVYDDLVLFAGGNSSRTLTALSAQTGRTLWTDNHAATGHNCPYDLLVVDGLAWVGAIAGGSHSGIFTGWDPYTGQVKKQFPPDVDTYWFHHRCYRCKATDQYIMSSRTGVEFIDFRAEHWIPHHWVRGGCIYGVMPCNGLLYAPPHDCACYAEAKLSGFCALAPAHTDRPYPQAVPDDERLKRGPAYSEPIFASAGSEDWPTYRHDAQRSGCIQSIVPADLKLSWQTPLGGRLTSLVIANGKVYVASVDTHTVYALNEDDGEVLWSYTAGGRVDSPPTIYNGRVLFGSADGWVYCLGASDGELIWRFQAAPEDLRLPAFEQLESVWPVHGSVLVQNDMVYCVAGRSMFLDGGLHFLRLDPMTGRKLSETILDDRDPETAENLQVHVKGLNMPVALPDVLSSDGEYLFMRSQRFALQRFGRLDVQPIREQIPPHSGNHIEQGSQQYGQGVHLFSPFGFLDGTWFHRSYWVFGRSYASGAGGYYQAGRYAPAGRILVFDDSCVYGFGRQPQYFKWTTPLEYQLFAAEKFPDSQSIEYRWAKGSLPLMARAMVLAGKTLFIAGPKDVVDEEEAFDHWANDPNADPNIPAKLGEQDAALEDQYGALLWAVSTSDGNELARYNLESLPVWDGMAAANGRLYVSMKNGKVQCLVGANYPPIVDAGEDLSVYPMAATVLDATVTDDGFPKVDPCEPGSDPIGVTTNWTKSDGPGQVSFGDPCVVETTAWFSQWGEYTLRLTAFDGGTSYYDDINISVLRPGDLDCDKDVDAFDLGKLAAQWLGECNVLNDWCSGADQTASGSVSFGDYAVVASNWLSGVHPAAPENLAAVPGDSRISLDWDDNAESDLAGYNVYRRDGLAAREYMAGMAAPPGYVRINESLLADSEYVDTSAVNYRTYYYIVTAEDIFGYESAYADEVSACPGIQPVMKLLGGIGVTTSGTEVTHWADQAKNNDARQDTADDRPALMSSAFNGEPAIDFDGSGEHLDVADSDDINMGGPYSGKTLVVVFKTGSNLTSRQVIWEQGGGVRGLSFYLDSGNLYINGWNLEQTETQWGPTGLNKPVSANTAYVATLVLNAGAGTFEGFVNGASMGAVGDIARLHSHSNDCAFGHVEGATKFHDGSNGGPANFAGQIAEFHQYNEVLPGSEHRMLESALKNKYGI